MSLNDTPRSNRVHIGFYGKRNSGKSSLINALTGQKIAIVSDTPGTTTDPVYKSMEIHGIGPCLLIDTAGFDDTGELGRLRVEKTEAAAMKTDIALLLFSDEHMDEELEWFRLFKDRKIPVVCVISRIDFVHNVDKLKELVHKNTGVQPVLVSVKDKASVDTLREHLVRSLPEDYDMKSITGDFVNEGDLVLQVMPQDIQAPKGRLILPQVQTIRELLDKKCLVVSITTDKLEEALNTLVKPPKLIITDSQVFREVSEKKPEESLLTSFSVLFAGLKGDLSYYVEGAAHIESLTEQSRILIAECCTHAPLTEDIGREKIPAMLRKKIGQGLKVDVVSGMDFPKDLSVYDLIIQCGACMFNRRYVMSRIEQAKRQNVPMTNYGVAIAYLTDILDKITY